MKLTRGITLVAALAATAGVATSCGSEAPVRVELEMETLTFTPEVLTVAVGDTLVWVNRDLVPHTVSSGSEIDSGVIAAGEKFEFVPVEAGELSYVCDYHPGMRGTLRVGAR